jgi:hypothetical protein
MYFFWQKKSLLVAFFCCNDPMALGIWGSLEKQFLIKIAFEETVAVGSDRIGPVGRQGKNRDAK